METILTILAFTFAVLLLEKKAAYDFENDDLI